MAGDRFSLAVTISNDGNESALISIQVDETVHPVAQWCLTPPQHVALEPQQSSEVFFDFEIPLGTLPNPYPYQLIIDAPDHYPENTPIVYPTQIYVLPTVDLVQKGSDPTLVVQPPTTSAEPQILLAGEPWPLEVWVDNRSERVDRFRLSCQDLPPQWQKVIYPDRTTASGLAVPADSLELNPDSQGMLQFVIQPPPDTPAGIFAATIQLHSVNQKDLTLLDVAHFQILPIYDVGLTWEAVAETAGKEPGRYQLILSNQGNTPRQLHIALEEETEGEPVFDYGIDTPNVQLLPGEHRAITITLDPKHYWRRPFFGKVFNFTVAVTDLENLPLYGDRFKGSVVWSPRPWWQFWLVIMLAIGTLGVIVFLIWRTFFQPKPIPEILAIVPDRTYYQEENDDLIRLNWQVTRAQDIGSLKLVGLANDGRVISGPFEYDLTEGLPQKLQPFCELEELLVCDRVPTNARQAEDYRFELSLFPKPKRSFAPVAAMTKVIRIDPIPEPTLLSFSSLKPRYEEDKGEQVLLQWQLDNLPQTQSLQLIVRSGEGTAIGQIVYDFNGDAIVDTLGPYCEIQSQKRLSCQGVPTGITTAGDYQFDLRVQPRRPDPEVILPQLSTPLIAIAPKTIPVEIVSFQVNGQPSPPKVTVVVGSDPATVALDWEIKGGPEAIAQLQPAPGTIPLKGTLAYPLKGEAGEETITLQVTNGQGETISRSVVVVTKPLAAAIADGEAPAPPPLAASPEEDLLPEGILVSPTGGAPNAPPLKPQQLPPSF